MDTQNIPNGVSPRRGQPGFGGPADVGPQGPQGQAQPAQRRQQGRPQVPYVNVGKPERVVSSIGGGVLLLLGLARRSLPGLALAALGGSLLYRGLTGHCGLYQRLGRSTARRQDRDIYVEKSVTINRPVTEVYRFFRDLQNLPRFMKHVQSVQVNGDRSHWVVKAPPFFKDQNVEWDAQIVEQRENESLVWRSLPDAEIPNEGAVRFRPAPGGRGTEVHVMLRYDAPAGKLGALVAKLLGEEPELQADEDLHRLKQILETGEIPTTEGQPRGAN